jgi:hypothetical protein
LFSPDLDVAVENFSPDDPEDFSFLLWAIVGRADSEGEELLQLVVCTPRALRKRLESEEVVFGRSLVIIDSPDMPRMLGVVRSEIERHEGETWREVVSGLTRLGFYEGEDYYW